MLIPLFSCSFWQFLMKFRDLEIPHQIPKYLSSKNASPQNIIVWKFNTLKYRYNCTLIPSCSQFPHFLLDFWCFWTDGSPISNSQKSMYFTPKYLFRYPFCGHPKISNFVKILNSKISKQIRWAHPLIIMGLGRGLFILIIQRFFSRLLRFFWELWGSAQYPKPLRKEMVIRRNPFILKLNRINDAWSI